jgi:ubiquinone biosynthesis protein Coq4
MKSLIFEKMYEITKKPYQKWLKKNQPWNIDIPELINYPEDSLGFHLGNFLVANNFEMQPKLEDHDIIHVLTNTGVTVEEEIGMQFYLLGNGKRSLYLYMVIASGTLFYPYHFRQFLDYYQRGKKAHHFHDLQFLRMLSQPIATIRETFSIC